MNDCGHSCGIESTHKTIEVVPCLGPIKCVHTAHFFWFRMLHDGFQGKLEDLLLLTLAHIYIHYCSVRPPGSGSYNIKHPQSQAPTIASVAGNSSLLKYCKAGFSDVCKNLFYLFCFVLGQEVFATKNSWNTAISNLVFSIDISEY